MPVHVYVRDQAGIETLAAQARRMLEQHGVVIWTAMLPEEERRTDAQNRFMWPMVRQLGPHLGSSDERETLNFLLIECFKLEPVMIGDVPVIKYPRTSQFKKPLMQKFLSWVEWYAQDNGYPLLAQPGYDEWANSA